MALFGTFSTVRAQAPQTQVFTTAFAYIEDLLRAGSASQARLRAIASGSTHKLDLGHGVVAIEQVFVTKPRAEGFFESHRTYIDVQVVVEGEELMEVIDIDRIAARGPYVPERDVLFYDDATGASQLRVFPGQAAIFFPVDVHMPALRLGAEPVLVRKTVVKVPVG